MPSLSQVGSHATILPVKKMDRAVKFYTETLGGKVLQRMEGEMKDFWASIKVAGCEFWLVTPGETEKRTLAYDVFAVDNIKAIVKDMVAKGVKFQKGEKMDKSDKVDGPIVRGSMGASAFFKDSEGNLLMLWQNSS